MKDTKYQEKELFLAVFSFFKNHLVLLAIMAIIGGALGFGFAKMSQPTYSYSSEVCSDVIEGELLAKSMANLSGIVESRDLETLSRVLNLSLENCESISSVNFEYPEELSKRTFDKDKLTFGDNCISLKVVFQDSSTVRPCVAAIQNYVKAHPTFVEIQENTVSSYQSLYNDLKVENDELNQLQKSILSDPREVGLFDLGYTSSLHIQRELAYLRQKLVRCSTVAFFTSDAELIKQNKRNSLQLGLAGAFAVVFLTVAVLLVREINKMI